MFVGLSFIATLFLPNVFSSSIRQEADLPQVADGNFVLHVATEETTVEVKVFIDDVLAAYVSFQKLGGFTHTSIPSYEVYAFNLSEGLHHLRAESINPKKEFQADFVVEKKKQWAFLYYTDVQKYGASSSSKLKPFSLRISNQEIFYE